MKKFIISLSVLISVSTLFVGCNKKPNVPPVADEETKSAVDASLANFIVTDVDMITAFLCTENIQKPKYQTTIKPAPNDIDAYYNNSGVRVVNMTWDKGTRCRDGRIREGSIFIRYYNLLYQPTDVQNQNNKYYRDFEFVANITFSQYMVDSIKVEDATVANNDEQAQALFVKNLRPNGNKPVTDLSWSIEGSLIFTDIRNTTRTEPVMSWSGKLVKRIKNLETSKSFTNTSANFSQINWDFTAPEYTGSFSGVTSYSVPYACKIYDATPLVRDFSCFPDKISSVATTNSVGIVNPSFEEFHPFVSGVASFTSGTLYPREIYFDNVDNTYGGGGEIISLPAQCDNKGAIQIKGVYFPVDFRK
jgi:hypothetical protein